MQKTAIGSRCLLYARSWKKAYYMPSLVIANSRHLTLEWRRTSNPIIGNVHHSVAKKLVTTMKMLTFMLFVLMVSAHARTSSQNITYQGKNLELLQVFSVIKSQTGYAVFGNFDFIETSKKFDVNVKEMPLKAFLTMILKDQPIDFTISNKTISLSRKMIHPSQRFPTIAFIPEEGQPIKGKIIDEKGKVIYGASIMVKGTTKGTTGFIFLYSF